MAQVPPSRETQEPREPAPGPAIRLPAGEPGPAKPVPRAEVPAEGSEDLPERMLGEFRILRRLGKGGMAEVYLAEQTSLKRNVAIKMLREERVSDDTHLRRFKTEAMAAAALSHPNIIQVYMIGHVDKTHFIAQEYVQGMNLREYVTRKGPPEMGVAVHIMKQAAGALQAAHAAGIVHRDIKPENIMLTRKGDVKIADFGLAQLTQEGERLNLTQVGVTMGTPLYMSPEQVNGKKLDARTDIYSLGVTCYHMLTGSPPFRGETALSVAVQHLKQEPERLEHVRGDLPVVLCRIVQKMMAKNPDKRYQSAAEILRDLKRLTQVENEPRAAVEEDPLIDEPEPRAGGGFVRRFASGLWHLPDRSLAGQGWIVVLLALLAGVASAGMGWLAREPNPFEQPARPEGTPRKNSAAMQYFQALNLPNDEAAWQAVIDYDTADPKDDIFKNYARQHLAYLQLVKGRFDDAQPLLSELALQREPQWRTFGLAGEAYILNRRGDYQESQKIVERLKGDFDKLGQNMQFLFRRTVEDNFEGMKRQMDDEWKKMLQEPHADAATTPPREEQ